MATLRDRWQERERNWERRLAVTCCTIMRAAGANVKLEDFLPQAEKEKLDTQEFKNHMAGIPGVKRTVKGQ